MCEILQFFSQKNKIVECHSPASSSPSPMEVGRVRLRQRQHTLHRLGIVGALLAAPTEKEEAEEEEEVFWRWFAWWTHAEETDEDECEGVKKRQVTTPLFPHHASRINFLHMHASFFGNIPAQHTMMNNIRQWDILISYSNGWIWINGRSVMIFFVIEIASCWISHCLSLRRNARLRFYSIVSNFIIKAVSKARDARRRRWGRRRIEACFHI